MDSTEFYRQEEMKAHRKCDELSAEIESLRQQLAAAHRLQAEANELLIAQARQLAAAQAKIDALMPEYCPDEMTQEQLEEWGRNQKPVEESVMDTENTIISVRKDYYNHLHNEIRKLQDALTAALAACEAKDKRIALALEFYNEPAFDVSEVLQTALAIKPDASALKAHDEALIERCAEVCEEYQGSAETCAAAIRELKSQL